MAWCGYSSTFRRIISEGAGSNPVANFCQRERKTASGRKNQIWKRRLNPKLKREKETRFDGCESKDHGLLR